MVIQRAQKATKITALGFTDLDFESFVKVFYLHCNNKYTLYNNIPTFINIGSEAVIFISYTAKLNE